MTFRRLISSPSVRARIIVIAAIPVLGFLANGIAFMVGEKEVARAFATVREADALSEASRELKSALELMRVAAWDFALRPSNDLIKTFQDAHALALRSLETTERSVAPGNREAMGGVLPRRVNALMANFINLITEQEKVGFTEADGMRRRMRDVAAEVERLINQDMSWLQPADVQRLLNSLLIMRRHEAEFRLNRVHSVQQQFFEEFKTFNKTFDAVVGAAVLEEQLAQHVKTYADTFARMDREYRADRTLSLRSSISIPSRCCRLPTGSTRWQSSARPPPRPRSRPRRQRTRHLIVWVGFRGGADRPRASAG